MACGLEHGRPSYEGRGLKLGLRENTCAGRTSPLIRGAWIEMTRAGAASRARESPLIRGAWIVIPCQRRDATRHSTSPLIRGAWIEMSRSQSGHLRVRSPLIRGAWIEILTPSLADSVPVSPLIRGAWIEISASVDGSHQQVSPLIRGAWIEILPKRSRAVCPAGRPSYEGRGLKSRLFRRSSASCPCRPSYEGRGLKYLHRAGERGPLGRPSYEGRGLKFHRLHHAPSLDASPLIRGAWIEILKIRPR